MIKKILVLLVMCIASTVNAAEVNTLLNVTAQVNAGCIMGTGNVNFGDLSPSATQVTSIVRVRCNNNTTYKLIGMPVIPITNGFGLIMTSVSPFNEDKLEYNVFLNAGNSSTFSNGENYGSGGTLLGTDVINGVGTGQEVDYSLYFKSYGSAYSTPGNYTDNYTLSIQY